MIEITASTDIDAPADTVWRVLTDLDRFHAWNPFIREAHGSTEVGGTVHVRVQPSLRVPLRFNARILARQPNRELRWRGHVLAPWLASGDHSFTIEPLGDGRVRFTQRERFSGLVPRLAARLLRRESQRGFDAMNEALAARAENALSHRGEEERP
jgi:hypothetical protein